MKKLLFLIFALPLLTVVTASCDNDGNVPNVDIKMSYANATVVDSKVYVVKPDTLIVKSVTVTAVDKGHAATNGPVTYWFDGVPVLTNPVAPFGVKIPTDDLEVGKYALQFSMPVYEEGCELATAAGAITVNVVGSPDDIPESSGGDSSEAHCSV